MTIRKLIQPYTFTEEMWHCILHTIGIILGITALPILITFSAPDPWKIVSCSIFATSIIVLYVASTLYHAVQNEKLKKTLKKFDHISIYYLIAGTYTPYVLVNLRSALGWTIFGIIWGLAFLGTALKLILPVNGSKGWSVGLYLTMGWLIVFASKFLFHNMNKSGIIFLLIGGLLYSLGIPFYLWKSKRYTHAVWHFFVLSATIMHFFSILFGVVM